MSAPGDDVTNLPVPATAADGVIAIETASPTQALHLLTDWAVREGLELGGLTVNPPSLEDIYLRLTSDSTSASVPERTTK